jgi:hypothetical protein
LRTEHAACGEHDLTGANIFADSDDMPAGWGWPLETHKLPIRGYLTVLKHRHGIRTFWDGGTSHDPYRSAD